MKLFLSVAATCAAVVVIFLIYVTRDGHRVTPSGSGYISLETGEFEAFPLPAYALPFIEADYKSYFVEVESGIKIHVLEVGEGFPVYAQHGNPTTGMLYRRVAEALPHDRVRVIMPTMVGLGFSSKIPASEHTLENHMRWMNTVIQALGLEQVIYVGQDWGGPVGMGALSLSPGVLSGAVLMNTGFNAPREKRDLSTAHATVKTPVVGELIVEVMASAFFKRLAGMQGDPSSMPSAVRDLYYRPLTDSGNLKAPLALMRMVADGPDHPSTSALRDIEQYVDGLDVPAEIVWGMNDPILGKGLSAMTADFPEAPVTKTEAGHFLQEEVPEAIAGAIIRVIDAVTSVESVSD